MITPQDIQLIGSTLAIKWSDGREDYLPAEFLRKHSPSAENTGEPDILGRWRGGAGKEAFPGVSILDWDFIGNYALRFRFSDGHASGLYSYPLLRRLGEMSPSG